MILRDEPPHWSGSSPDDCLFWVADQVGRIEFLCYWALCVLFLQLLIELVQLFKRSS